MQRGPGIETDVGIAPHQRVGSETGIEPSVLDDEEVVLLNGVGAERNSSRGLAHPLQAHVGFEPLTVAIDQADQGDRRAADGRGGLHQAFERQFRLAVQHLQGIEGLLALLFSPIGRLWDLSGIPLATGIRIGAGAAHSGEGERARSRAARTPKNCVKGTGAILSNFGRLARSLTGDPRPQLPLPLPPRIRQHGPVLPYSP